MNQISSDINAAGSQISVRHQVMHVIEVFCAALMLTILIPSFMVFFEDRSDALLLRLYAVCWLIFPFALAVRMFILWRARSLIGFIAICLSCISACCAAAYLAGTFLLGPVTRMVGTVTCGILLANICLDARFIRTNELGRQKAMRENDFTWVSHVSPFEIPRYPVLVIFAFTYLAALLTHCSVMCNVSLISASLYLILALVHQHMRLGDRFLQGMHHVKNVPVRRMRRIGTAMLGVLLAFMLLVISLSFLAGRYRPYQDIREWSLNLRFSEGEMMYFPENIPGPGELPFMDIEGELPEGHDYSEFYNTLMYIIFAVIVLVSIPVIIRAVKERLEEFEGERENDDIITPLTEETDEIKKVPLIRLFSEPDSAKARVRRMYRKTIRKHRKDRPQPYEMPADIEEKAGIAGTPEGTRLHAAYEEARYS